MYQTEACAVVAFNDDCLGFVAFCAQRSPVQSPSVCGRDTVSALSEGDLGSWTSGISLQQ